MINVLWSFAVDLILSSTCARKPPVVFLIFHTFICKFFFENLYVAYKFKEKNYTQIHVWKIINATGCFPAQLHFWGMLPTHQEGFPNHNKVYCNVFFMMKCLTDISFACDAAYTQNPFIYLLDWSVKGERCEQDLSRRRHDSRDGGFAQVVSCTRMWSDMMAVNLWNNFTGLEPLFTESPITVTYWKF